MNEEQRRHWYNLRFVQFEIVKCLKHRELSFLSMKGTPDRKRAVRYLLAFSIDYLNKHWEWFNFMRSPLNMYQSVALLKPEVPVFSYNLKERTSEEEYVKFGKEFDKYVESYNFLIDLDGDDTENLLGEAMVIKRVLDEFQVPYYVLNSSKKGFHFVIPAEFMPHYDNPLDLLNIISDSAVNLKGIYMLKGMDSTIYDNKRICKVPYSYSCDDCICLPLNDEQLENFTPEMVSFGNVMSTIMIRDRGLQLRTHNQTEETLKLNVRMFLDEFK